MHAELAEGFAGSEALGRRRPPEPAIGDSALALHNAATVSGRTDALATQCNAAPLDDSAMAPQKDWWRWKSLDDILKPYIMRFRGVILLENVVQEGVFVNRRGIVCGISGNRIITSYAK